MNATLAIAALCLWTGLALVLSRVSWFARPPLIDRLRPYAAGPGARRATRLWSGASFRDVIGPLTQTFGNRIERILGVSEALETRLQRVHSPLDSTSFRVRQLGWTAGGFGFGLIVAFGVRADPVFALAGVLSTTLLAFLLVEQRLSTASKAWQRRLFLELPTVAEQLAILLSAGYSLGGAMLRLSVRSDGACARDLRRVCLRLRQGLSETNALREWADIAKIAALDRLVSILCLSGEASDLGRMVSDEARNLRRDVHRELLAAIERKAQQVWIPVTVATLVPGVIFIAVPFVTALKQFTD